MSRLRRGSIRALLMLGGATLAGCGDLTSGGVGDLEVVVSADSVALGESALTASSPAPAPIWGPRTQSDAPGIEGTLNVRIRVFVLRRPERWLEVTEGPQDLSLTLGDPAAVVIGRRDLPAGPYHAVRTVFHRVEANVQSGLEVDGVPVTGRILVDLGLQDRLQIETGLQLDVVEGKTSELVVDLHAERWLRRLDSDRHEVAPDDFKDELRLRHHR